MAISKRENFKLKLGNLFLASILSIVPTSMTIGFLGVHGLIVCKGLEERMEVISENDALEACKKSNIDYAYKYIFWIWLFITIPTWRWFYIGHYRRIKDRKL